MTFGQGVSVLPVAGANEALAGCAVEGVVAGVADLLEAEDEFAQVLGHAAERVGVALGGRRQRSATASLALSTEARASQVEIKPHAESLTTAISAL